MMEALKGLLSSKKAIVAIVGIIIAAAGKAGLDLSEDSVHDIVQVVMAYLVGQGVADHGKESAKVVEQKQKSSSPI